MSLSDALRAAALERARKSGQNIDGIVLEPSGVIDLREMARAAGRENDRRIKLPMLAGRALDERIEDESLADTALWRRLRPVTPTAAPGPAVDIDLTAPEPITAPDDESSSIDTSEFDELAVLDDSVDLDDPAGLDESTGFEPVVIDITDRSEPPSVFERNDNDAAIDATLADEAGRPVAVCGHCGSFGQRDLFDRFSRTEYYSCDDCGHMWQQKAAE